MLLLQKTQRLTYFKPCELNIYIAYVERSQIVGPMNDGRFQTINHSECSRLIWIINGNACAPAKLHQA